MWHCFKGGHDPYKVSILKVYLRALILQFTNFVLIADIYGHQNIYVTFLLLSWLTNMVFTARRAKISFFVYKFEQKIINMMMLI